MHWPRWTSPRPHACWSLDHSAPRRRLNHPAVRQRQALCVQPQALQAQKGGQCAVQRPLAVGGVADQRVGDVLAVAADLVAPALQRFQGQQGHAGGLKTRLGGDGPVQALHGLPVRLRRQMRLASAGLLGVARQRVVDQAAVAFWPAAHQAQIALVDLIVTEPGGQLGGGLRAVAEQQHAAGALVQSVRGAEAQAELGLGARQHGVGLVRVQLARVHQQARRFVDGDPALALVQQAQGTRNRRAVPRFLDPLGGRAGRSPVLGAFSQVRRQHRAKLRPRARSGWSRPGGAPAHPACCAPQRRTSAWVSSVCVWRCTSSPSQRRPASLGLSVAGRVRGCQVASR